jgi:hypothetical protein
MPRRSAGSRQANAIPRLTAEILDRALRELMTVATDSRERLGEADGIPIVTAMAAFEAPPGRGGGEPSG